MATDRVIAKSQVVIALRCSNLLIDRATRVLQTVTGLERGAARALLDRAGGRVKTAIMMHAHDVADRAVPLFAPG